MKNDLLKGTKETVPTQAPPQRQHVLKCIGDFFSSVGTTIRGFIKSKLKKIKLNASETIEIEGKKKRRHRQITIDYERKD